MQTFTLPELGENLASGEVTRVLIAIGDTIAVDQAVLELETEKATVEVPSSVGGVVTNLRVKAGDTVNVGDVVLTVGEGEAGSVVREPTEEGFATTSAVPARPEASDALGPSASAKVLPMPRGSQSPVEGSPRSAEAVAEVRGPRSPASPAVRRLAREIGVGPDDVTGTGPGGRLTMEDVKQHARSVLDRRGGATTVHRAPPLPDFSRWGDVERKPMSGVRRKTAEHLSHAWATIPHVTQCDKADITNLEALRKRHAALVESRGGKLTMTAILIKVLGATMQRFPQFNASVDSESSEILYKRYLNVGVAVDTDRGLLVPVVRDVGVKNLTQISVEVQALAAKARDRKLTVEDMSGGGMTISNLGGIGGTYFTPIINWPEVAILGVSRGAREPVYVEDAFEPRLMLPLSLSYDHRAIDGADAMRFLRFVVSVLEQPSLLALQG